MQPAELRTPESYGITEIGLRPDFRQNDQGETVIRGYFMQDGVRKMTEDVWFAADPSAAR